MTREQVVILMKAHGFTDKQIQDIEDALLTPYRVLDFSINKKPIGHWKQISPAKIYECSVCGKNVMTDDICAYHFCHGCGVNMEVKE